MSLCDEVVICKVKAANQTFLNLYHNEYYMYDILHTVKCQNNDEQ